MKYSAILFCCLLYWVRNCEGSSCNSSRSSAFKFTIRSLRNETGHWVAQVHLGHHAQQKDVGPWQVDIDHSTEKCEDTEAIDIYATITAPTSARQAPRAPGYELVPGLGYYKLNPEVRRWHEALDACKEEGTHLLILNSEEEARAMNYFFQKYPNYAGATTQNWAWIGFHDQYKEGEYVTVFNDPLATTGFMKWSPTEPNGKNQDCGLLGKNFLLADFACENKQPFFCEKEI